jgi:hypothetical protein
VFGLLIPVVLATVSLLGLRGFGGFYLSPVASFAVGGVALATTILSSRSCRVGAGQTIWEIGLALAISTCGAALVAALIAGQS